MSINPLHFMQALYNALRMDKDERARRMMAAFISRDIYHDSERLQHLAQQIGGEFEEEVDEYLRTFEMLVVEKVWSLDEANEICIELGQRINDAQKRIEEESNG